VSRSVNRAPSGLTTIMWIAVICLSTIETVAVADQRCSPTKPLTSYVAILNRRHLLVRLTNRTSRPLVVERATLPWQLPDTASIGATVVVVPHLKSKPDPLLGAIERVRRRGFNGLIRVTSEVSSDGRVTLCQVDGVLSAGDKTSICGADLKRRYQSTAPARLIDTFHPPSLR